MLKHPKNKVILGLFAMASVILLVLGLLFYTFSGKEHHTSSNSSVIPSEFATTKADVPSESKEAGHFNIFSILNRFLSN